MVLSLRLAGEVWLQELVQFQTGSTQKARCAIFLTPLSTDGVLHSCGEVVVKKLLHLLRNGKEFCALVSLSSSSTSWTVGRCTLAHQVHPCGRNEGDPASDGVALPPPTESRLFSRTFSLSCMLCIPACNSQSMLSVCMPSLVLPALLGPAVLSTMSAASCTGSMLALKAAEDSLYDDILITLHVRRFVIWARKKTVGDKKMKPFKWWNYGGLLTRPHCRQEAKHAQ